MLVLTPRLFSQTEYESYVDFPVFGPYEEDLSSYHIKVRFVYLDGSTNDENAAWWKTASTANTGGDFILEDESKIALQRLNSAFNSHGIYFLPDAPGFCVELYDIQGRQILQSTLTGQRSEIRLPEVQGLYIVMIYTNDTNLLHRQLLVIQ